MKKKGMLKKAFFYMRTRKSKQSIVADHKQFLYTKK